MPELLCHNLSAESRIRSGKFQRLAATPGQNGAIFLSVFVFISCLSSSFISTNNFDIIASKYMAWCKLGLNCLILAQVNVPQWKRDIDLENLFINICNSKFIGQTSEN